MCRSSCRESDGVPIPQFLCQKVVTPGTHSSVTLPFYIQALSVDDNAVKLITILACEQSLTLQ